MRTRPVVESSAHTWRQRAFAAAIALLFAGFLFSHAIRSVFFLLFAGFLLAVVLDYPVRWLTHVVRRRAIAAVIVFLAIVGGTALAVRVTAPKLMDQGGAIAKQAPESLEKLEAWWNGVAKKAPVEGVPTGTEIESGIKSGMRGRADEAAKAVIPVASGVLTVLSTLLLVLVIAMFMVASPQTYADGIVRLVPKSKENATREFLDRAVRTMRGWMTAQLLSMTFVGLATAGALAAIGVRGWFALAILNFFCEFVPYVGPVAGSLPGIGVAFADSTQTGLWALGAYVAIQQLEGLVVSPLAMRREVHLAPPLLLAWQVLMGAAFGIPGIILATPILAMVKVAVDYFWVEQALGKAPEPQPA